MLYHLFILQSLAAFSLVSAHVQMWYPEWRGNSFTPPFSQLTYPCAGFVDNATTPRTLWPLTGGSINVTLHDAAAYIFINIGLGTNSTNFNYTLFSAPLNETGAGNLCFPKLTLPSGLPIQEGTNASIQFATSGHNGEGLYNCADITFSSNASLLPADQCVNSSTITVSSIGTATVASNTTSNSSGASPTSSAKSGGDATYLMPSLFVVSLMGILAFLL